MPPGACDEFVRRLRRPSGGATACPPGGCSTCTWTGCTSARRATPPSRDGSPETSCPPRLERSVEVRGTVAA